MPLSELALKAAVAQKLQEELAAQLKQVRHEVSSRPALTRLTDDIEAIIKNPENWTRLHPELLADDSMGIKARTTAEKIANLVSPVIARLEAEKKEQEYEANCSDCGSKFVTKNNPVVFPLGLLCPECSVLRQINQMLFPTGLSIGTIKSGEPFVPTEFILCERETGDQIDEEQFTPLKANADFEKRIAELEAALEADATDLWKVTNAIKKVIAAREWIMEGRGCYAWDDNRYKDETRLAFEEVLKLIKDVQHPAQMRFHKVLAREQDKGE